MKGILSYRYFIQQLAKVNILTRYKKTRLGVLWMLLSPLLTVVIWVTLHKAGLFQPGDTGISYPAYVFFSTTLWALFYETYRSVSESVTFNSKLLLSHRIPYGTIVIERMIFQFVHSMIPLLLSLPVIYLFGAELGAGLFFFFFSIIPLLLFGVAIGMVVAVLKVVAVDFSNAMDEFMRVVKFLCPVVYASQADLGFLNPIVKWNPLTYLIGFPRDLLLNQHLGLGQNYLWVCLGLCMFLLLSYRFFTKSAPLLVERLFGN